MKMLILTCFSFIIAPALIYCQQVDRLSTIQAWPGDFTFGYYPFIDYMRGNLWGYGGSLMPSQIVRIDDRKKPGDYLCSPTGNLIKSVPFPADTIFSGKINKYIGDMLNSKYANVDIGEYISNFRNVRDDSTRNEFFGRFLNDGQKMSMGGWVDKFAVIGVYIPFDDAESFLESAKKYFILPELSIDSLNITNLDSIKFYEYIDVNKMCRLRGFDVLLRDKNNKENTLITTVIEFTKYYDPEFVP
jgi:hypothetical protein